MVSFCLVLFYQSSQYEELVSNEVTFAKFSLTFGMQPMLFNPFVDQKFKKLPFNYVGYQFVFLDKKFPENDIYIYKHNYYFLQKKIQKKS
jgi:hypothetical protein